MLAEIIDFLSSAYTVYTGLGIITTVCSIYYLVSYATEHDIGALETVIMTISWVFLWPRVFYEIYFPHIEGPLTKIKNDKG